VPPRPFALTVGLAQAALSSSLGVPEATRHIHTAEGLRFVRETLSLRVSAAFNSSGFLTPLTLHRPDRSARIALVNISAICYS
jgi:hypothetical protein